MYKLYMCLKKLSIISFLKLSAELFFKIDISLDASFLKINTSSFIVKPHYNASLLI